MGADEPPRSKYTIARCLDSLGLEGGFSNCAQRLTCPNYLNEDSPLDIFCLGLSVIYLMWSSNTPWHNNNLWSTCVKSYCVKRNVFFKQKYALSLDF